MKKQHSFIFLAMAFITVVIISNISASNTFTIAGFINLSAAEFLFPVSYVINDILIELYNYNRVKRVIWFGLGLSFFATFFLFLTTFIPSGYEEYNTVFGVMSQGVVGITVASFFAFLVGSFTNAIIMEKFKQKDKEHKFFKRAIISTIFAEVLDSLVFITLCCTFASAFYSWDNLLSFVLTITTIKITVEILIFPLTNYIKNALKKSFAKDSNNNNINSSNNNNDNNTTNPK